MTVVYIDVLFLINFCMDFLALSFSGAILHLARRGAHIAIASAVGGVYAVLAALYPGNAVLGALIGVGAACLLCYIAYGHACRAGMFFCLCALFYGVSCLLGGMITGAYEFLQGFFENRRELYDAITKGDGKIAFFFALFLSCAFLLGLFRRHFHFKKEEKSVDVTLSAGGKEVCVSALVDSGNTLCDPISGRPCIVVAPSAVRGIIPDDVLEFSASGVRDTGGLAEGSKRRIRLIPAKTVGGHSLLVGYKAESITVAGGGGARTVDALLVIGGTGEEYCGHAALIPSILI